jgi:hypothetical protein
MNSESDRTGVVFHDRVGLGDYFYADFHRMTSCRYPEYLDQKDIKPYYIPFRALTNRDFDNLLVAGKTMAQTFHANAATRLHPVEWVSGLAAGIAANIMVQKNLSTSEIYQSHISELQERIKLYGPIDWTL